MAIEFDCPACYTTLRVAADAAGRVVRCGSCLATLRAPTPPPDDLPPPTQGADAPRPVSPAGARAEPVGPYDQPRPEARRSRRRRPPQRPAGRGGLFWVLVVLGVVGLLTVAACGGMFALLQPRWRPFESRVGGFRVELPADPRPDMADLTKINGQPGSGVEGTVLLVKLEVYAVIYADLDPAARRLGDDALLDQAVKGIEAGTPGTKVVRQAAATVSDFPAREVVLTNPEGTYICRVVRAGPRVFVASAGGVNTPAAGNERTKRFLDSFQVTDPALLAARDRLAPIKQLLRQQRQRQQPAAADGDAPR